VSSLTCPIAATPAADHITNIDPPVPAVSANNTRIFTGVLTLNIFMEAATNGTLSNMEDKNHNTVLPKTIRRIEGSVVKIAVFSAVKAPTSDNAATANNIQIKNLSVVISVF